MRKNKLSNCHNCHKNLSTRVAQPISRILTTALMGRFVDKQQNG